MRCIWFRTFWLVLAASLLGVFSNLAGPHPIPWIRGQSAGAVKESGLQGDLSVEAMKLFSESGYANILDARRREDFAKGRIQNALSFDVREFEAGSAKLNELLKSLMANGLPFIIYCNGGHCEDSHNLAERLKGLGLKPLIFAGGWEAWSTAGLPVETGEPK